MSAAIEAGIESGISSAVSSGPSIGTSVDSIGEFTSPGSFAPNPSSGGHTMSGFSLSELLSMPEVSISPSSFSMDTTAPVPELAFSDKLFTTIAAPKPKEEEKPLISSLLDLPEVTVDPQGLSVDTASPVNTFDRDQFEVIYLSESLRAEEQAENAVLPKPTITVDSFQTESLTPLPFLDVPITAQEIDLPEVEAQTQEQPTIDSLPVTNFISAVKANETKADNELAQEIESFVEQNFAAEPELVSIFRQQLEAAVGPAVEPQTETSVSIDIQPETLTSAEAEPEAEMEAESETETYVNTEILLPQLVPQTQTEMVAEESKKQVTVEEDLETSIQPPVKATFWDVYHIKQVAQKSATALKERTKRATTLIRRAFSTNAVDPSKAIRREARILDDIDAPKGPQILDFKLPEIAPEIATMPDEDLESEIYAQAKVGQIIEEKAPVVTIAELIGQEYLPFERLPKAARRTIIERDAKHVNQPSPNGSFQNTLKLELITNDEIETETEKTANPSNKLLAA